LSAEGKLAEKPLTLKAGTYYWLVIKSDGPAEKASSGAAFFRNCWIDEIVELTSPGSEPLKISIR
jgi:hypothetical protein